MNETRDCEFLPFTRVINQMGLRPLVWEQPPYVFSEGLEMPKASTPLLTDTNMTTLLIIYTGVHIKPSSST